MKTVSWLQGLCKVVLWWTMKLSYNVIMPLNLITQAPNSICVLTLALLSLGLLLCVTDQQLLWEHGPVWNRTVYAPTAAAPGPPPPPPPPRPPPPQAPHPTPTALVNPLKKPPKWIRRPVGASFAVSYATLNYQMCITVSPLSSAI